MFKKIRLCSTPEQHFATVWNLVIRHFQGNMGSDRTWLAAFSDSGKSPALYPRSAWGRKQMKPGRDSEYRAEYPLWSDMPSVSSRAVVRTAYTWNTGFPYAMISGVPTLLPAQQLVVQFSRETGARLTIFSRYLQLHIEDSAPGHLPGGSYTPFRTC